MPTLPVYTPGPTPTSVMRAIMARYHADMTAQIDHTLADLAGRWQGVRATIGLQIDRLEQQMAQAAREGRTVDLAWLTQEQRLAQLKAAVEGDIARYAQGARSIIGDAQLAAIQSGSAAAQDALAATLPPGMGGYTFGVPPQDVLDQMAGAAQPYSPLSQLFDEFGPAAAASAQQALFTSVALGEGPRMAAQRLEYATNMSAQRAEVIARTEIMRSWRGAQMENYRANSDVVQGWQWAADFGPRCCGACMAMDGSIHPLDELLDDHICGRCAALPLTTSWADILAGTGADTSGIEETSINAVGADGMARETGADWFARQEPALQNSILGPAKAEAYRAGELPLEKLIGVRHDPVWGSSIEERSLRSLGMDAQRWLAVARGNGTASSLVDEMALARAAEGTPQHVLSAWEQMRAEMIAQAEAEGKNGLSVWDQWRAEHNIPEIGAGGGVGRAATEEEIAAATQAQADAYRAWQQSLNLPREDETAFAPLSTPGGRAEARVYDLTAADRAFLDELRGVVPVDGVTSVDEALALGQPLAERINASLADLRGYAEEERLIYQMAPNLTDAQRAWAMGEREATAAHGGIHWTKAAQEFQAEYQAQARAYLSAFRETGGVEVKMATEAEGFDALVATRLDAASQMLPADWLQASNDLGEINVIKSGERSTSGWYEGRYTGEGTLAVRYVKASDMADLESTALHELTHRMEEAIPQLSDLQTEFYTARTAGEEFVALTNGVKSETKLDEWLDQYLGRKPINSSIPPILQADGTYRYTIKSYELMTMGVEMALAPGASASTFALQADSEYEAFVLGALLGVRAPVADAAAVGEADAAAAVKAAENEIAYAARRVAGTALSDAERSAIQDAVSAGDLPKTYGKYTSVEQLVKTARGRAWYEANTAIKAEAKVAEEVATAARTALTDVERQAVKDAVASGDLPKSYAKYATVEQLTKTARGQAWYEANVAAKAEETAAEVAYGLQLREASTLAAEEKQMAQLLAPGGTNVATLEATKARIADDLAARLAGNPDWLALREKLLNDTVQRMDEYGSAAATIAETRASYSDAEATRWLLRDWASTEQPDSFIALQQAIQNEFGLTDALLTYDPEKLAEVAAEWGDVQPGLQAFSREMYNNTQDFFAEHDISEVTVYRGMNWETPPEHLDFAQLTSGYQQVDMVLQPASSFTSSPYVAGGFAMQGPTSYPGEYHLVIAARVPVADILATAQTGFGAIGEYEVVALGGRETVWAIGEIAPELPLGLNSEIKDYLLLNNATSREENFRLMTEYLSGIQPNILEQTPGLLARDWANVERILPEGERLAPPLGELERVPLPKPSVPEMPETVSAPTSIEPVSGSASELLQRYSALQDQINVEQQAMFDATARYGQMAPEANVHFTQMASLQNEARAIFDALPSEAVDALRNGPDAVEAFIARETAADVAATTTEAEAAAQAALSGTLNDTLRLVSREEAQTQAQQMRDLINPASGESIEATKARIAQELTVRLADNPVFTDFGEKLRAGLTDLVNGQRNLTATMKADSIRLIERDFADKNVARQLVSAWAQMDTPLYSAIQQAIRDEFNMADAWAPKVADQNMRWATKYLGDLRPGLRAFAREMYNNTQEYFAEQGITEVPLYRGLYFDKLPTSLDWQALRDNYLVMDMQLQAASSFSTDPATAYWFAANGRYQVALAARVPVEQIIGTAQTGFGSRAEYEMVVLGSLDQAWAIGRYKTLTLDDAFNLLAEEHQS